MSLFLIRLMFHSYSYVLMESMYISNSYYRLQMNLSLLTIIIVINIQDFLISIEYTLVLDLFRYTKRGVHWVY